MKGVVQPFLRETLDQNETAMLRKVVYLLLPMCMYQSLSGLYDGVDVVPAGFHFLRGLEKDVAVLVRTSLVCRQVDHREVQQVQGLWISHR
jgi:hypothetical protein